MSPPRMFAIISLFMIALMLVATGLTLTPFYRQVVIDREAAIVRDMVNALAQEHGVSAEDLDRFADPAARQRLDQSFNALRGLKDVVRIKVFNRRHTITWADNPIFVGSERTAHMDFLMQALGGESHAVFNPAIRSSNIFDRGPPTPATIEFYVPISQATGGELKQIIGVLALYRHPDRLNRVIRQGLYLLWSIIAITGLILFAALFALFNMVYSKQKTAELKFSKLTNDHQRIVQLEKLSAMGELVGEIAHQLNNPLVGVVNLAQLAEREASNPERVMELLGDIKQAGTDCREAVQRLLRLNQNSRSEPKPTDLNNLVVDTIALCHQTIDRHQSIEFSAPADSIMLNVDPVLMRHAVFNIVHNAMQASPGSPVTISLQPEEQNGVPGYRISVTDQGAGISEEVKTNLFKPFFTTRPHGTGLGLAVARHIVMKHGGALWAENAPPGGAQFHIWLPAVTML